MKIRNLDTVAIEGRRDRGVEKADKIIDSTKTFEPRVALAAISTEFDIVAGCLGKVLDNFDPLLFFARGNHRKTEKQLGGLFTAAAQACEQMSALREHTKTIAHTDAVQALAHQNQIVKDMKGRFGIATKLFETNTCRDGDATFMNAAKEIVGRTVYVLKKFSIGSLHFHPHHG